MISDQDPGCWTILILQELHEPLFQGPCSSTRISRFTSVVATQLLLETLPKPDPNLPFACTVLFPRHDSNSTDLLWFKMRNDRFLSTSHTVRQVFWCVKVQQSRSHFAEPDSRLLSFPWSAKTITWYYLYGFSRKSLVFVILVRVYRKKSSKLFWLGGFVLLARGMDPHRSFRIIGLAKGMSSAGGDQSFRHWAQALPEAVLSLSWDDTGVHRWTSGTVVKPIPNRKGHWMVNGGRKSGELPSKHFMKTRRKSRYTTVHWCLPESVHQRTCHVVTRFARLVHQSEGPKGDYFFIKVAFAMQITFSNDIPNVYPRRWSDLHSSIPQLISWDRHSERLDHKEMECEIVKCISTTGGFVGSCCLIFAP